jgi:hypothetical protein
MLTMLALSLALVQPEPDDGSAWTAVEAAFEQWHHCTVGAARQRAHEAISADEAGQEAATACEAEGARWRQAYGAWLTAGHGTEADAESMAAFARCQMARRGAAAAVAYRPAELASIRSTGPADERRCPPPPAALHGEAH